MASTCKVLGFIPGMQGSGLRDGSPYFLCCFSGPSLNSKNGHLAKTHNSSLSHSGGNRKTEHGHEGFHHPPARNIDLEAKQWMQAERKPEIRDRGSLLHSRDSTAFPFEDPLPLILRTMFSSHHSLSEIQSILSDLKALMLRK